MAEKRAFITGLEGFTGRYLAAELSSHGYSVYGSTKAPEYLHGAKSFACDVNDQSRLTALMQEINPDVVIHLAGIAFAAHGCASDMYRVNLLGTLSLLEALVNAKCQCSKVLLAGSAHAYGNQAHSPIAETSRMQPNSDYGVSKLAVEHMARLWFDRLPIILVRPFNYTGVGQSLNFLPPKIVRHFVDRAEHIELGNTAIARDWSDVRDVVTVYRLLIESNACGMEINVCSGASHSLGYVLETMSAISGHRLEVRVNPDLVRSNEVNNLWGDNSLLRAIVGDLRFRPLYETLSWMYRSQLEKAPASFIDKPAHI